MGFGSATAGVLFLTRRRSDLEFQVQSLLERKLTILDHMNEITATKLANPIFTSDSHTSISVAASQGTAFPVDVQVGGAPLTVETLGWAEGPTGDPTENIYEQEMIQLSAMEKEIDCKLKIKQQELEAVKAELESLEKIAKDHAKKDFKVG